ncbi:conserved hypothetical protein, partial [Ixodes scapularis]
PARQKAESVNSRKILDRTDDKTLSKEGSSRKKNESEQTKHTALNDKTKGNTQKKPCTKKKGKKKKRTLRKTLETIVVTVKNKSEIRLRKEFLRKMKRMQGKKKTGMEQEKRGGSEKGKKERKLNK